MVKQYVFDEPLKTCTGYLSTNTNCEGKRVWRVILHNLPICSDTTLENALAVAAQTFGRGRTLQVWNGDKGEWDDEHTRKST